MHALHPHRFLLGVAHFFEHALAVVVGLLLMILGLALGVTMVMLPAGIVIGLLGVVIFIGGLFAHFDSTAKS